VCARVCTCVCVCVCVCVGGGVTPGYIVTCRRAKRTRIDCLYFVHHAGCCHAHVRMLVVVLPSGSWVGLTTAWRFSRTSGAFSKYGKTRARPSPRRGSSKSSTGSINGSANVCRRVGLSCHQIGARRWVAPAPAPAARALPARSRRFLATVTLPLRTPGPQGEGRCKHRMLACSLPRRCQPASVRNSVATTCPPTTSHTTSQTS